MNLLSNRPALATLGLLGLLSGCSPEIDAPATPTAGTADFSRYIAVGNSLTAGFSDNGLYREGQLSSYPNILAQQFAMAGGGTFEQPLFSDAQANGSGYLQLVGLVNGSPVTATVPGNGGRGTNPAAAPYTRFDNPINNLGIPGIRLSDVKTPGYGSVQGNPYFERITPATNPLQTYLQRVRAEARNATFFTTWLGNNDVLGYATAGGGSNSITPTANFVALSDSVLTALTRGTAKKGVVMTIPDVTGIPFFTTVGPAFRATLAAATVPDAAPFIYTTGTLLPGAPNTRVSGTIGNIRNAAGEGNLLLTLTSSPYVGLYGRPTGKYWRDFYAQARPALPATIPNLSVFLAALAVDTTKAFGQSTANPFPSILVLDGTEQDNIAKATTAFNNALTAGANARNLAVFDANAFFRSVAGSPFYTNGVRNTAGFVSGNLFSLDGVHPAPRGYAVIANEIIKTINAKYGSTLRTVNAEEYRGVRFP